jgi:hypothetical protein
MAETNNLLIVVNSGADTLIRGLAKNVWGIMQFQGGSDVLEAKV